MEPVELAMLFASAYASQDSVVLILDGQPVQLEWGPGFHMRIPKGTMTKELQSFNGHGESVLDNASEGMILVSAVVSFLSDKTESFIQGVDGQFKLIDPSKVSFAARGSFNSVKINRE